MKLNLQQIKEAIENLAEEYKFDPSQTLEIIKMWIKTAFRKDYLWGDKKIPFEVHFDSKWNVIIQRRYVVVDEVKDPIKEISIEEAKKYRPDVKLGDEILVDITPENLEFSRIAVQAAAQTIKQNIKRLERERFFEKFKDKQGELLKAKVLKTIGDNNVVLDIDWTTVVLPPEWQVKGKVYNTGEEIVVLLKQIGRGPGWVVLDITQSAPEFVESILKQNVPEIEEWKVKIEKIVRIPWIRSKVLVSSDDPRVDPVGVFVWIKWERISDILRLLNGEIIDFVEKVEDPKLLIKNALKPAKVEKVEIKDKRAIVKVPDWQKALAIWKQASNVKLASQLTGYKIEII